MNAMNSYIKKEVAIIGANTTFGKTTSFLLKQSPLLSKLTLYDDKSLKYLDDIKYINTPCKVSFVDGREHISEAIKTADIIIIGDDNPKEMSGDATLISKAPSFSNYVKQIAEHNSEAIIVVATNPVNMTVPLAAEVLRNLGKLDERKLIGMSNVENIKARSILAHHLQISPGTIDFPVIGGLTSETNVPLLSNMNPRIPLSKARSQKITCAIKTSATKLQNAETSPESLTRAYAAAKLVKSIVAGLNGQPTVETVFSCQKLIKNVDYFSMPVLLGESGIINHMAFPNISQLEKSLLSYAIPCMNADSKKAKDCYNKMAGYNNFSITITPPQNKLTKLKPSNFQNKQQQSQHAPFHNGSLNKFQSTESNETSPSNIKLGSTTNHISSTISTSNENMKKSIQSNKILKFEKNQKHCGLESKKVNNTVLLMKEDSFKQIGPKEPSRSEVYSLIKNKINSLNKKKSSNIKPEIENVLALPKNIKKFNTEENITSGTPIFNFMSTKVKTISVFPQFNFGAQKCVEEKNDLPIKNNYSIKQYTTTENVCNYKKYNLSSENLENVFTSNIKRMVNKLQNRKGSLITTPYSAKNKSEHVFDKSTNAIHFGSKFNAKNIEHFDLFKIKSSKKNDDNLTINKTNGKSISDTSCIISNDSKTSGKKYSLLTNQPHWILHSTLFSSEKYQSSKRPILSRYVSSESHDNQIKYKQFSEISSEEQEKKVGSLPDSQTKTNQSQETSRPRCILSQFQGNYKSMKEYVNSNNIGKMTGNSDFEKEKKSMASLSKSQQHIVSAHNTFSSRYKSPEIYYNEVKHNRFIGFNSDENKKQNTSLAKSQTNLVKPDESLLSRNESSKLKNEGIKNEVFETSKGKFREIDLLPKSKSNFNASSESMAIPSGTDNVGCLIPPVMFRLVKNNILQKTNNLEPKGSSDIRVFENLLQKQKNSISSGHKLASFKSERSEDSFFVQQRKLRDFEMIDRLVPPTNKRNELQKLHLLTKESKLHKDNSKPLQVEDINRKNNYFKKIIENSTTNISNQKRLKTTGKNINKVSEECMTGDKKKYSTHKGEREKHDYREKIDNHLGKCVNSEVLNISNNQATSQNDVILESNEPRSKIIMSEIGEYHSSKSHENRPCENNSNSSTMSKYIQQISNSNSETNIINTEVIKKEESS